MDRAELVALARSAESGRVVMNGNTRHGDDAPPWLPDEERGEPTLADLRYEFLRSRVRSWNELEALPAPEALIEDLLFLNTLASLFGKPGSAKTGLVIAMAGCVASGLPFYGRRVRQGNVLYIAAEGGNGLGQRQQSWRQEAELAELPGLTWLPLTVNLLAEPDVSAVIRLAREIRPVLVVIDTLARMMSGADENRSGDMAAAVSACDRIREATAATVLPLHHTPKESVTLRGHSVLEGALDTAILMEDDDAASAGRGGVNFTMTVTKQKDSRRSAPLKFTLREVGKSYVLDLGESHGTDSAFIASEIRLRAFLRDSAGTDGLSTGDVIGLSGIPKQTFHRAKVSLVSRGVMRNVGTKNQPRWALAEEE